MITWQFSTDNDIGSFLIRFGTRSDWSHVDAVLPDGSLLGALPQDGVQIRPPNYAPLTASLTVSLDTDCETQFYEILKSQIGKPYDWRAVVSFAFGDRDWQEADSWFCSELQVWAIMQCGFFKAPLLIPTDRISPRDQLLLFSPWFVLNRNNGHTIPHNSTFRLSPI